MISNAEIIVSSATFCSSDVNVKRYPNGEPLITPQTPRQLAMSLLHTVWIDGQWVRKQTFNNIREIARSTM